MTDCTNTKNKIQASYGSTACGVCTTDSLSLISNHNSYINNKFNHYLYSDIGSLFPENDSSLKNCDNSLKNCDNSLKNCDNSLKDCDNSLKNCDNPDKNCDNPDKNCDNSDKNCDNSDKNCDNSNKNNDNSNKNNDNSYLDNDIRNCYVLDNRCYVEKLGKQLKDLLKCIDIKDSYLSNYETITVVGK